MSVTRHALAAGAATLITRVSGLFRQVIFAGVFGATAETDAFLVAQRVPNLFRDLFAEGSMSNAFVPNFSKTAEEDGITAAWALANALIGLVLLAIGIVTVLMVVFAEWFVLLFASGFAEVEGKVELTMDLVRIIAPFLGCVSLASIFGGMLNVRGRFFLPALAPALANVGVIVGCLMPERWEALTGLTPITTVSLGYTIGGAGMFILLFPSLRRMGFHFRPTLRWHPAMGRLLRFLGPALIGVATIQLGVIIDFQLGSSFGDGPVSYLEYAFRIVQLPMNLFAGAIAVAGLAALSALVVQGKAEEARKTLAQSMSLTSYLVAPSAVAMFVFATPIVQLFYERGEFSAHDTAQTAMVLRCYAYGAFAFCIHRVVVPSFYAFGDAWTPMLLSIGTLVLKIPVAIWWTREWMFGFSGIPLAHAAVASAEVLAMFLLLRRRAGGYGRQFWADNGIIVVASLGMGAAGMALLPLFDGLLWSVAVMGIVGSGYLLVTYAIRLGPARDVLGKVLRRGPKGLPPHIDPDTRAALRAAVGTGLLSWEITDGEARIETTGGALVARSREGVLEVRLDGATGPPTPEDPLELTVILDTSRRPPPMWGLVLRCGEQTIALKARGDSVVAEEATGPALPVPPPDPSPEAQSGVA